MGIRNLKKLQTTIKKLLLQKFYFTKFDVTIHQTSSKIIIEWEKGPFVVEVYDVCFKNSADIEYVHHT